jgi:Peptidase family C25
MKNFFTIVLLLMGLGLSAQSYNNEWIDFSKTYYKFKVGVTGLQRIPQAVLANAGLGSVPVQNFQLFRNGQEVPIYTSAASGTLGGSDYIEFWGQANDGAADAPLYRSPTYQHTQHWSLETDTSVYFLTVNPTGNTFHYVNTASDPSSTTLSPEPYFMYTTGSYFKTAINPGFAQVVGEYLYSSSYDIGEFWASGFISPGGPFNDQQSNLFVYNGGPTANIKFGMTGAADDSRTVQVSVNGSVVADTIMNSFYDLLTNRPVPVSLISGSSAAVSFINNSAVSTDRMVASFYELTYPRQFNFGGQQAFPFQLAAKSAGYLLNIANLTLSGVAAPVLYDLTNGLRYTGVVGSGNVVSFVLGGSTAARNMVLVNEDPAAVQTVTVLTSKTFVNFANTSLQGNYLIISNPLLYTGSHGNNPVVDYKTYRSSAAGGSYDAQIYDINELVDQFGFGIKKHPLSVQNFLRYARNVFSVKPQFVFLIGHGMDYVDANYASEGSHDPLSDVLNAVPTFGYPASDNKLTGNNGIDAVPNTPIGRLSVVSGPEIEIYLQKIQEYEQAQAANPNSNNINSRLWMKNVVHLTGVSEPYLGTILCNDMNAYAQIISDTLCGDNISTFCDGNATAVTQVPANVMANLFSTGIGIINYFGHSSNEVLGYGLDAPGDYNNTGKYPVFLVNGCDAGDFFIYNDQRIGGFTETLSETYVLAKEKGSIAFVAGTSFEIVNYMDILMTGLYNLMDGQDYMKPLGILEKDALQYLYNRVPGDFFARLHVEQVCTHGDPALKLNQEPTDYDIEASQVQINPSFISASSGSFQVKARFYNLGKAVNDSVLVQVQRQYPNGTKTTLYSQKRPPIYYTDSISLTVPIITTRDVGDNKIIVSIDPGQTIPEVTYGNNSVSTDVFIYQNDAQPVYPYNYSIINTPTSKLVASSANPLGLSQQFIMEVDTTQAFNSPLLVTKYITTTGGEMEFDPGITFRDSVVYYWRTAVVPANNQYVWNNASFVYIDPANSSVGSNQSHYFQHLGSTMDSITLPASRQWTFTNTTHNIYVLNSVFPYNGDQDNNFTVAIDGNNYMQSACLGHSLVYNVINPVTFHALLDVDANGNNLFIGGSAAATCGSGSRVWNFEFSYMTPASRYQMMQFMDNNIPNGYFVVVRSFDIDSVGMNSYSKTWHADTALFGAGKSLYNYLLNAGLTQIDSINSPRCWAFIYQKNSTGFTPVAKISQGLFDAITLSGSPTAPNYTATVTSPQFGPALKWGMMHWRGHSVSSPVTDTVGLQVIGIDTFGVATSLYSLNRSVQDFDVSAVNAKKYPYLEMKLTTSDSVHAIPYQLDYWRLNYTPVPEGALAPNILLKAQDTVLLGQPIEFAIAFKNVSPYTFADSMLIKMYIQDHNNVMHTINLPLRKLLVSGDTITLDYIIDSKAYTGANVIYVDFNPNNNQPEQYQFNNFVYKNVYVKGDSRNPNMDVTFDNVHILNNDIVSARPHIQIKLASQASYLLLTDTSLVTVQVQFPDGSMHSYKFNTDTLRFTPATSSSNNTATVDFTPAFTTQYNPSGDEYQLVVTGKDALGNPAGVIPYRVGFTIINKAMISNMLNYPNPFTTSTAFVFTITGSQVPQNIKIEILTITGKIVREITKEELGPLHVGLNITEFKWNGTDMYGQRLANGVYLYHVVTNLNGKSLSKYTASGDDTNKFFNNGYGKMYLMK